MSKDPVVIQFSATLHRPAELDADWSFLRLTQAASEALPTRSMQSVEGTFNGVPFIATLLPDGEGGHWLKVPSKLQTDSGAKIGDAIAMEITPVKVEPEPEVPTDFQGALDESSDTARATWAAITALARRDWIFWIVSGKKAETRQKRIQVAMSKLSAGSRRPCCFDRSGMYDKSLSCPRAADEV